MRTSEQIYHQIRWDSRFQAADYRLGVQIRQGPVQEIPLLSFQPHKDIPWHRILYIKGPHGLVWDRHSGLDQLIPNPQKGLDWPLHVLLWNVCAGKHGTPKSIPLQDYDLRVLLEAGDEFCHNLPEGNYRYRHQEMLVDLRYPPLSVAPIHLTPGKDALLIQYSELQIAVAHFTSNYRQPNQSLRNQQWQQLEKRLQAPWLVLGDLNAGDDEVQTWQCQDLTPPTPSFKNRRYQRILSSPDLDAQAQTEASPHSDHHPIYAQILKPERSYQHALAILPPHHQPIQDIRKLHDPAYDRWPPHLNLVFPGPSRLNYDRMRLALADIQSFRLRFKNVECFHHKVYYWAPENPEPIHQITDALGYPRITPHLTLGRKPARLDPWEFEVLSVDHLENQQLKLSIPLRRPHPAYDRIRQRCAQAPIQTGSSLYLDGQDLDLVTTHLPEPLENERQLPSLLRGPDYDLADASHWQAVEDRDALFTYVGRDFPAQLNELYKQLHKAGLKGQAWGLPGGLAWAVILATGASDYTRPIGLHRHDPSGKPMTVWSPHPPGTNLTAHVPKEFLEILQQREYDPLRPYLDIRETQGMELIMDLLKQFKATLRPFVHENGCYLSLKNVDPQQALRHAQKLGYRVSLRDG